MRKLAISDIHGCACTFEALLDKIALSTADELYLLGDYVDRGPDSKSVLDLILALRDKGYQVCCLRGNHEDGMLAASRGMEEFSSWYHYWGGRQTLESFGVQRVADIPAPYLDFISDLGYFFEMEGYIMVHAGLNFAKPDPLAIDEGMLYIRNWHHLIDYDWLGDRYIIHGHTPCDRQKLESGLLNLQKRRVLDIDAGCFACHIPGMGQLCAFDLTNQSLHFQTCLDDVSGYWNSGR
jgi:serine/threonine protein phosphatase 1